jgi:hypothetical protein
VKTIHQLFQSLSALNAFLGAFYLFLLLTLAATAVQAGQPDHHTLKAALADLTQDGYMTDALNHLQVNSGLPRSPKSGMIPGLTGMALR